MNKYIALATAGVVAVVASFSVTAPSQAFFPHYGYGYGVGAGIAGFMVGAALAGAASHDRWYHNGYYGGDGWDEHVAACAATYKTYSVRDDRFTTRAADGELVRVPCGL